MFQASQIFEWGILHHDADALYLLLHPVQIGLTNGHGTAHFGLTKRLGAIHFRLVQDHCAIYLGLTHLGLIYLNSIYRSLIYPSLTRGIGWFYFGLPARPEIISGERMEDASGQEPSCGQRLLRMHGDPAQFRTGPSLNALEKGKLSSLRSALECESECCESQPVSSFLYVHFLYLHCNLTVCQLDEPAEKRSTDKTAGIVFVGMKWRVAAEGTMINDDQEITALLLMANDGRLLLDPLQNHRPNLRDVACAQRENQVARPSDRGHFFGRVSER